MNARLIVNSICLLVITLFVLSTVVLTFSSVTIANDSKQPIDSGEIDVAATKYRIPQLQPGNRKTIWFVNSRDGGYEAFVRLKSGQELHSEGTYFLSGMPRRDLFSITDNQITCTTATLF